jgi:hypothetical protein
MWLRVGIPVIEECFRMKTGSQTQVNRAKNDATKKRKEEEGALVLLVAASLLVDFTANKPRLISVRMF